MSSPRTARGFNYRQARGELVSYLYNAIGTDTTTAADKAFDKLCTVAESYNLSDREVNYLLKLINKVQHEYKKKYL
jgi:hypothetical protein